jgi:hypothetical protein
VCLCLSPRCPSADTGKIPPSWQLSHDPARQLSGTCCEGINPISGFGKLTLSVILSEIQSATDQPPTELTMASTMTMKQSLLSRQAFTSGSARPARRQPRTLVCAAKVNDHSTSETTAWHIRRQKRDCRRRSARE